MGDSVGSIVIASVITKVVSIVGMSVGSNVVIVGNMLGSIVVGYDVVDVVESTVGATARFIAMIEIIGDDRIFIPINVLEFSYHL